MHRKPEKNARRSSSAEARLHHSLFEILGLEELPSLVSLPRCIVSKSKKHFIFEKTVFIIKYENVHPWIMHAFYATSTRTSKSHRIDYEARI
jgi:hypothetical protein